MIHAVTQFATNHRTVFGVIAAWAAMIVLVLIAWNRATDPWEDEGELLP